MNDYFACLWDGTDLPRYSGQAYDMRYVLNLYRNIQQHDDGARLTMLADDVYLDLMHEVARDHNIRVIRFSGEDHGGWSRVLEIFQPALWPMPGDRCLAVGLDTVFTGDPQWLFDWHAAPVGLPRDPIHTDKACDAVISFSAVGASIIWQRYLRESETGMQNCLYGGLPSEMVLLRQLQKEREWPLLEDDPSRLLSYRCHVMEGASLDDTSLVYFHGSPKPSDLDVDDPIRIQWESCTTPMS